MSLAPLAVDIAWEPAPTLFDLCAPRFRCWAICILMTSSEGWEYLIMPADWYRAQWDLEGPR
jgi:hypothetical protein